MGSGEVINLFYGEYQHTLDQKGRAIIPSKFREGLGPQFILTKGLDSCLFAYSLSEWLRIEEKLKALPFTDKDVRSFVRFFFRELLNVIDKQGRILVPVNLREYAHLKGYIYIRCFFKSRDME